MNKRIIGVLLGMVLLLLFPILLWSLSPNNKIMQECDPDSSGSDGYYLWLDIYEPGGPVYNWIDITGAGMKVEGLTDDNNVGPFQIGFDFFFYGFFRDQFWVNANGAISFSDATVYTPQGSSGFIIPSPNAPNDLVIPLGADLVFSGVDSAECYYYTNNVDTFIVSYINVAAWDTGGISGAHTFQLMLTGQDSCIYFQYNRQNGQFYQGQNCAGIEDGSGLQVFLHANPDSGYAVKIIPIDSVTVLEESEDRRPRTEDIRFTFRPNPLTSVTKIELIGAHKNAKSTLSIYNASGRRVREISLLPFSFCLGATWDGRDDAGKVLPPGFYFLKLNGTPAGKVVKVR
jgi:hypothetical protein